MESTRRNRIEHRNSTRAQGRQKSTLGPREKRRLLQLCTCLLLFGAVFFAKGADRLTILRRELSATLGANADLKTAFADLGRSVAVGKPVGTTLQDLWTDVFLAQERISPASYQDGPLYQSARKDPRKAVAPVSLSLVFPIEEYADPMADSAARTIFDNEQSAPSAEPAVIYVEYNGPALPDNTTMNRYALGLGETVAPVMAPLASGFGWREHPIEGGEKFHYGLDLAADLGTPVRAFAAGKVDYIGESEIYGQYLQLDHGNGVTSFYAHCSKLYVQQGQHVECGETVALSGASGHVTGAHLHFEIKKDGVRLNPLYYVETTS